MKKLLLAGLALATLTGCGTKETTRVYIDVVPSEKAVELSSWVKDCEENNLDKGMLASCYSLGSKIFSETELHLRYSYKDGLGGYLYSESVPCTEKTLTMKEKSVCSGELEKIVQKQ